VVTVAAFAFSVIEWVIAPNVAVAVLFLVAVMIGIGSLLLRNRLPKIEPEQTGVIQDLHELMLTIDRVGSLPYFARSTGPGWDDFERGLVVRRKEVDEITERILNQQGPLLVVGPPASGKTVALRHVGYLLVIRDKLSVSYVDVVPQFGEIERRKAQAVEGVLILDNAHRSPEFVESLLRSSPKQRIVIGSRMIHFGATGTGTPILRDAYQSGIHLRSEDVFEEIVDLYLRAFFSPGREPGLRKALTGLTPNLWHLGWALEACRHRHDLGFEVVPDKVQEYLTERLRDWLHEDLPQVSGASHAAECVLVVSAFYQHEISVHEGFLTGAINFGIVQEDVDRLVRHNEVTKERGMLLFPHSQLARLYLSVLRGDDRLTAEGRHILERPDWEHYLTMLYLADYPSRLFEVLAGLRREEEYGRIEGIVGDSRFPTILQSNLGSDVPSGTRITGFLTLVSLISEGRIKPPAGSVQLVTKRLVEFTGDQDAYVRALSATSLRVLGPRILRPSLSQVLRRLLQLSEDPDAFARRNATEALYMMEDKIPAHRWDAIEDRFLLLTADADVWVRNEALSALRNTLHRIPASKKSVIVDQVLALTRDPDRDIRWRAVGFLADNASSVPVGIWGILVLRFLQLLHDPYVGVRLRVLAALRKTKEYIPRERLNDVVVSVLRVLNEENPHVQLHADATLRHLLELLPENERERFLVQLNQHNRGIRPQRSGDDSTEAGP
jgi:HEAT repeat protein